MPHDQLNEMLEPLPTLKDKINVVVNNILLRHLEEIKDADKGSKMTLLLAMADVIHGGENMISTRRLARIVLYLALLFAKVETLQ